MAKPPTIGLALSGGGARAIAFHLGCLRALHDRGILDRVAVLSAVSGGSVIAALYAYHDEPFAAFEARVLALLRRGLVWGIVRQTFFSCETPRIVAALLSAGLAALVGGVLGLLVQLLGLFGIGGSRLASLAARMTAPLPRFASRTTAFERHLRTFFGDRTMDQIQRGRLKLVLNATELRTGSAFRFGSDESGCWRLGCLTDPPRVSMAVAASAAFPALLPAFDAHMSFERGGALERHRAIITDGGVYDNLGISCLLPGRSSEFSTNAHKVDFLIACDAGQGMPSGAAKPYMWGARMLATVNAIHRRTHTLSYDMLHRLKANGEIAGFLLPYLGQIDARLPYRPADLVPRGATFDYPTDFNPMPEDAILALTLRGEQLTRVLLDCHAPYL